MKINKWIVTLVMALAVCGSMKVKADEDGVYVYVVNEIGYHECNSGVGHYYTWDDTTRYDANYHYMIGTCKYCGDCREIYSEHRMETDTTYATPKKNGVVCVNCEDCDYVSERTPIRWRYGEWGSTSYDISSFSAVYKDSRSITVRLKNGLKGAILKVTIGNKTYQKKLANNKKAITLKIGRHPIGSRIKFKVTYKGRIIGRDDSDQWTRVRFAKQVRNGMTKEQVRYTWGSPDDTSSASGGWSYWYYEDGSSVYFQNGRVRYWYDAAG